MAYLLVMLSISIISLVLISKAAATTYTVGDNVGWDISTDLQSWASDKTFYTGDVLLFQYSTYHTLDMVDRDGYNNCNASKALLTSHDGNTSVPLTTAGDAYFICGFLSHCLGGMKLQVDVKSQRTMGPAGAPEAPPPLVQRPSTKNNDPSVTTSAGVLLDGRGNSLFVAWLCTVGALIWMVTLGG